MLEITGISNLWLLPKEELGWWQSPTKWDGCPNGVSQGPILGHLFFLIYVNDLPDNLISNPKLFVFSTLRDPNATANQINNDLHNINTWTYQWKMNSNPDTSKQAQEVIFIKL